MPGASFYQSTGAAFAEPYLDDDLAYSGHNNARSRSLPLIEYLKDKVYLGAFDHKPAPCADKVYFTIDDSLPYNNFNHDFGPLTIAHMYRFAVILHDTLSDEANAGKAVVFYSGIDARLRANAACILSSYMVLIQSWPPHLALAPISQVEPPLMPFRDAGYSVADFNLAVQDVVYGVWRAKQNGLCDIRSFNLEQYEHFELVENGDLNIIAPHFIAFASPKRQGNDPMSSSFAQVIDHFIDEKVQLVVRLNSPLYDKMDFVDRGIKHVDMYFDDGTCPSLAYVQGFIGAAECVIRDGGKIAVHCRAGLGRTGCLIGAHLIYTYGFTAQEAIGYMRFLRPGMVVGPQQHWLYLHQNEFRKWRYSMTLSDVPDPSLAGYCPLVPLAEAAAAAAAASPQGVLIKGRASSSAGAPRTPERRILSQVTNNLPEPTPGQPRKSPSPLRTCSAANMNSVRPTRGVDDKRSPSRSISRVVSRNDTRVSMKTLNGGAAVGSSENSDEDGDQPLMVSRTRQSTSPEQSPLGRVIDRQSRTASSPSPRRRSAYTANTVPPSGRSVRIGSGVHK